MVNTQAGTLTDATMTWYTGTCGSLTKIFCNTTHVGATNMPLLAKANLTPGATIWIRIFGDSGTFGNDIYVYPTNVEIASVVGYDTFFRLNNAWQKMMNDTGLAHSISTNWWSDQVNMDESLLRKWAASYQRALYYSLTVNNENLDKSRVLYELEPDTEEINANCEIPKEMGKVCIPCGE
jgi:hypothetical protein